DTSSNSYIFSAQGDSTPRLLVKSNGYVGISSTAPSSLLTVVGPNSAINGPHSFFSTNEDSYSVFRQLNWTHNNIQLLFDTDYDGSSYTSGSETGNFSIAKLSSQLKIRAS